MRRKMTRKCIARRCWRRLCVCRVRRIGRGEGIRKTRAVLEGRPYDIHAAGNKSKASEKRKRAKGLPDWSVSDYSYPLCNPYDSIWKKWLGPMKAGWFCE